MTLKVRKTGLANLYPFTLKDAPEGVYVGEDGAIWIVTTACELIEIIQENVMVWEDRGMFGHIPVVRYSGDVTFSNSDE